MPHAMDSPAKRAHARGHVAAVCVAYGTGTTNALASTAELVAHNAKDGNGNAFAAADLFCIAFPTTNEAGLYEGAAPTATQIDIRSTGTAVPYKWMLFLIA